MKNFKNAFFLGLMLLGLTACGGGGSNSDDTNGSISGLSKCEAPSADQAVVCGTVLAADGATPLVNAEINLANGSFKLANVAARGVADPDKCLTDSAGDFVCLLPSSITGQITLLVSLNGFDDTTLVALVAKGEVTETGSQILLGNISNRWVVIPGSFDGVQVLLAQLKGCTLTGAGGGVYNPASNPATARGSADCESKGLLVLDTDSQQATDDFLSTNELFNNDSLFVNCDANFSTAAIDSLVQEFVTSGGHVYFSDLSDSWLSNIFPGKINFAGNDTQVGTISSTVRTPGLQSVVGSTMNVEFDLPVWTAISSVASDVTTFVEGSISNVSNYTGTRPITVGWKEEQNSGCVFYTSYHIEGASQGSSQELAIKYLVQNISSVCQ